MKEGERKKVLQRGEGGRNEEIKAIWWAGEGFCS